MMPKCPNCVPGFSRRSFLRFSLGAGAGLAAASLPHSVLAQQTVAKQASGRKARAVIMLWMGGGPSHIDSWDPKPGQKNGGEFKAIDTTAPGVKFTEHLPICASQGKNICVIRSMATHEGAHERGTSLMHLGIQPVQGLQVPVMGTVISWERGDKKFPLPHFVAIDPPNVPDYQNSPFGDEYRPFRLADHSNPIPNVHRHVGQQQDQERAKLLLDQNKDWGTRRQQAEAQKVVSAYEKSEDVMNTPLLNAFNYQSDPKRGEYGDRFGINCLMARRLVEAGCSFVEIGMGGWDTHNDNFNALKRMLPVVDKGMGPLIKDMSETGLLKEVMVLWCGEFGRTPDINAGKGRDHWANGFSVVLAGGGIRGGSVYGDTGPGGHGVTKPVGIHQLFATIYAACGIDPEKKYETEGRKIKYASVNGNSGTSVSPLKEILA